MHAKGSGAYGTFTVTHDITQLHAGEDLLARSASRPSMFARFSTVAGERGAADAERDIRGFALKFYTEEGNWDLVGNNTPVFFFRDPLQVPRPQPRRQARPAHQHAQRHATTGTSGRCCPRRCTRSRSSMSDRGIPSSFRHMHGFGSHTFSFINADERALLGEVPLQDAAGHREPHRRGGRGGRRQRPREPPARSLRGIERGDFPRWTLCVQVMPETDARDLSVQSVRPDQGLAAQRTTR